MVCRISRVCIIEHPHEVILFVNRAIDAFSGPYPEKFYQSFFLENQGVVKCNEEEFEAI